MNQKINLDWISLKFILYRNKSYVFSVFIILVSILIFFMFVIPEFNSLLKSKKVADDMSSKLETLKSNLSILSKVNKSVLNSQYDTLILALPGEKDVIKILNSVYSVVQKTGVGLGSFSFKVGNISKPDIGDNFVVQISVPITADVKTMSNFIQIMSATVPLSEIDSVKIDGTVSTVVLSFYYKPLGDASNYSQNVPINPVPQDGLALIDQLNKFKDNSSSTPSAILISQEKKPVSTSSAAQ